VETRRYLKIEALNTIQLIVFVDEWNTRYSVE